MSRSRFLFALALLAGAGIFTAAPASAAACAPGFGIGLVEFPKGNKDPRAQTYVVDHVAPGAHFSRRFQVCNGTAQSLAVHIYPGAAEITNGAFRIVEGRATNELSSWIHVTPATVTLAPGERFLATATFTVPRQAESGERYAVLLAELPARPGSAGVQVASRLGIRVYLDVGPGGAPHSDFSIDTVQAGRTLDGHAEVTAAVHNIGKRALDIAGSMSLSNGPGGLSGGPYPAKLGTTLAAGDTEPVVVPIDAAIADGPWTAEIMLRSGLLERRGRAVITFPPGPGEAAPVDVEQLPVARDEVVHPERTLLTVGIAVLAAVAFVAWRRRRSRSGSRANIPT